MTLKNQAFEDVSPIENGDFPLSCQFLGMYNICFLVFLGQNRSPIPQNGAILLYTKVPHQALGFGLFACALVGSFLIRRKNHQTSKQRVFTKR